MRTSLYILLLGGLCGWLSAAPITLTWDPSPDPRVTGYNLYYGLSSRGYTGGALGITTNTVKLNLDYGTFYFAVTCFTSDQESDFSNEVSWTAPLRPPNLQGPNIELDLADFVVWGRRMTNFYAQWVVVAVVPVRVSVPIDHTSNWQFRSEQIAFGRPLRIKGMSL